MEKVFEKLNKEMEKSENPIEERIHVYLCNQIENDEELVKGVSSENKSIKECCKYLYAQGSKIAVAGVADVTPAMETEWINTYYKTEKISSTELKITPPARNTLKTKEVEKIVEVEKVIYKDPTFEEIEKYLKQKKATKSKNDKVKDNEVQHISLFE